MFSLTWPASTQFIGTKQSVYIRKEFNSHRIGWDTNMAAVSLFWNTNMAVVTSRENALKATPELPQASVSKRG